MALTVEVYKQDARTRTGERLTGRFDHQITDRAQLESLYRDAYPTGYRWVIQDTWVTRVNLQSGQEFQERYDTPHYCSPSSESYWCM
jgi:hypothetical protein